MVSYSCHISSKKNAVCNAKKLKQVSAHNSRSYTDEKSKGYDHENIEVLVGSRNVYADVYKVYEREFETARKEFNAREKHEDRKIDNYFNFVSASRNDLAVEMIIQLGDQEFWQDKTDEEKKQMSGFFRDNIEELQKLCPDFKIANAIAHYDEKSPHLHIVGVPVAICKRGMSKQAVKTKVFTQESLSDLQAKLHEFAQRGINTLTFQSTLVNGLSVAEKEKGRNTDVPKFYLSAFKKQEAAAKKELAELNKKIESAEHSAADLYQINKDYDEVSGKVRDKRDELNKVTIDWLDTEKKLDEAERQLPLRLEDVKEWQHFSDNWKQKGGWKLGGLLVLKRSDFKAMHDNYANLIAERSGFRNVAARSDKQAEEAYKAKEEAERKQQEAEQNQKAAELAHKETKRLLREAQNALKAEKDKFTSYRNFLKRAFKRVNLDLSEFWQYHLVEDEREKRQNDCIKPREKLNDITLTLKKDSIIGDFYLEITAANGTQRLIADEMLDGILPTFAPDTLIEGNSCRFGSIELTEDHRFVTKVDDKKQLNDCTGGIGHGLCVRREIAKELERELERSQQVQR